MASFFHFAEKADRRVASRQTPSFLSEPTKRKQKMALFISATSG
jgi:hypothetical protein